MSPSVIAPVALFDDIYLFGTLLVESFAVHFSLGKHLLELSLGLGLALLDLLAVRCSPLTAVIQAATAAVRDTALASTRTQRQRRDSAEPGEEV